MPDRSVPDHTSQGPALGHTAELADMLAGWLPKQRWFPGGGTALAELTVVSDVPLASGEPELRHLVVQTMVAGQAARFQVLVGARHTPPRALGGALIGERAGTSWYDALHDPDLAAMLLEGIGAERRAGPLRFIREPATDAVAAPVADDGWPDPAVSPGRVLTAEQSNTSLVFGDRAILKVLRRLFPGANPDLEVADALARLGSRRVATPFGWIETDLEGEHVLLGVLSHYLAGATDGWSLALSSLAQARPFTDQARLLGQATAELHADMAAAFGQRELNRDELAALAAAMQAKLTDAIAVVPQLASHGAKVSAVYEDVGRLPGPVLVQRIHGDYHLGQVLRSEQGWVALDFEGEPAMPLAQRRAMAPPLRDVAGMLRSFDYAARHQLTGQPEASPPDAWVAQCQAAFLAGYATGGDAGPSGGAGPSVGTGLSADTGPAAGGAGQSTLLRALTFEKAVYEVVYEYRHRPSWLPIPLDYLAGA
ncbi:MAG TPA: aminoglycoside phosphotransferase [Streptosporangiaceae bacterium]